MTKSKLWRKLGATQPVFRVWNNEAIPLELDDHQISSITVHRGDDSPEAGFAPSTASVDLAILRAVRTGERLSVSLSDYGADLLAAALPITAAEIKTRFFGRLGVQDVNDRGKKQTTTYYAASWQAQLGNMSKVHTFTKGQGLSARIPALMSTTALPYLGTVTAPANFQQYGFVEVPPEEPITFSGGIGPWATDLGIHIQLKRDGNAVVLPMEYRRDLAISRIGDWVPITRAQALAPTTWKQPGENMPRNIRVEWTTVTGYTLVDRGATNPDPDYPRITHNMRHVYWSANQNQPNLAAAAAYHRELVDNYSIPSITVDLLQLISSERAYDRQQAAQLLILEAGDPVYLSGDWYPQLRGIQFATSVEEKITPNEWSMTISLAPAAQVVGDETNTTVPPVVWDSATSPWDTTPGTWNSF